MSEPLRPLNKGDWPAGYKDTSTPERPVTIENAIRFGFRLGIGLTLWFVPFGVVCWIFAAIFWSIILHVH